MGTGARGLGRGWGQGRMFESSSGGAASASQASESQTYHAGSVSETSASASEGAVGTRRGAGLAGGGVDPGAGAAPAQDRWDRLEGLLTQILERLPAVAPVQASVQPRAVMSEEHTTHQVRMRRMQVSSSRFFSGRERPEGAEEWLLREERVSRSSRVSAEYPVAPVVVQPEFVSAVSPRRQQRHEVPNQASKPAQGRKRKWEVASKLKSKDRSCYGCGSREHRVASCPVRAEFRGARVCYHCREPGHIKAECPQLPR